MQRLRLNNHHFHNHWKVMKNLQYILCRNREDFAASEYIFNISANVWLLLGVFQYFLRNRRLLLKVINVQKPWKKMCSCLRIYFFILKIVWLLLETLRRFLKNVQLLLQRYQRTTASERKNVLLKNYVHLRNYFEQIKIKTRWKHRKALINTG